MEDISAKVIEWSYAVKLVIAKTSQIRTAAMLVFFMVGNKTGQRYGGLCWQGAYTKFRDESLFVVVMVTDMRNQTSDCQQNGYSTECDKQEKSFASNVVC